MGTDAAVALRAAAGVADIAAVRELFLEYAASLDFSLCFQGFDAELESLPGAYASPAGILLLAVAEGQAAGCIGVRPLDAACCEMKRLYVRPAYRGTGLGRRVAEAAIAFARAAGYRRMMLDTLPGMKAAIRLYGDLGFLACDPYYDNTPLGSTCMSLELGG